MADTNIIISLRRLLCGFLHAKSPSFTSFFLIGSDLHYGTPIRHGVSFPGVPHDAPIPPCVPSVYVFPVEVTPHTVHEPPGSFINLGTVNVAVRAGGILIHVHGREPLPTVVGKAVTCKHTQAGSEIINKVYQTINLVTLVVVVNLKYRK